jgi:hypothetical protein
MDAHANEYAAAVQGMNEVYGGDQPLPSIGDWVNGEYGGKRFSGHVMAAEPGRVAIEIDGAWIVVRPENISRF